MFSSDDSDEGIIKEVPNIISENTLDDSVSMLNRIKDSLTNFKKENDDPHIEPNNDDKSCIACLLPFTKGSYMITMPCCGWMIHISCVGQIANTHQTMMRHECPRCLKPFTETQVTYYKKLWKITKKNEI